MTSPSAALVRPRAHSRPAMRRTRAGDLPRLVLYAWAALFLNVLTPSFTSLLRLPHSAMQAIAQGSLLVALLFALLANRRLLLRLNAFLVLLSVLAIVSFAVCLHGEFIVGSIYRGARLVLFVLVLWLLSPWWGRRDLLLLRAHRLCLWAVLATVIVGAAIAPGRAFSFDGRLAGTIWPIPTTQVAHFAAVLCGTTVILWMCRIITGSHAAVTVVVTLAVLVATHTRTALLGALLGLAVASASLFLGHARVRKFSTSTLVAMVVGSLLFAPQLITWLARGQSTQQATQLTGRTTVWSAIVAAPRPALEQFFGTGLANKSFNGLPVDSSWLASYLEQGWFGVLVQASFVLLLLLSAVTHVRGPRRALALFLIVYCIVASVTETGLGDASPYLLNLTLAASLLAAPVGRTDP